MSGLAKYMEDEGLATTLVALVRKQAEQVRPPRALWVPYPLGRPFGVPNDPAFQTRVLTATLALLDAPSGPVLVDHAEEAPATPQEDDTEGWVCPVSFPRVAAASEGARMDALLGEIATLAPWYEAGRARRGRTTMGASTMEPGQMARFLGRWVDGTTRESPLPGIAAADALRLASEDLKAFYFEAATARPGPDGGDALTDWFWRDTAAGALIRDLRPVCLADESQEIRDVGDFMLVPEGYRD